MAVYYGVAVLIGMSALIAVYSLSRRRGDEVAVHARFTLLAVLTIALALDMLLVSALKQWLAFPRPTQVLPPRRVAYCR